MMLELLFLKVTTELSKLHTGATKGFVVVFVVVVVFSMDVPPYSKGEISMI